MNKHTIRDWFITIVSVLGIAFLYRAYVRRRGPLVRVLCFHDVSDREWFEKVMNMLFSKCNLITPEQFHTRDFCDNKINVLLTFDDGYQSWIDVVLPILEKNNIKGLFFLCSGLLDIADSPQAAACFMSDRLKILPKTPLMWSGARSLLASGHTIGGHTVGHHDLTTLSHNILQEEIQKDKYSIESQLSIQVTDFAYPFGTVQHYNHVLGAEVAEAGYTFVYTAQANFCNQSVQEIPRTLLGKNQSILSIKYWLLGGYDIFKFFY